MHQKYPQSGKSGDDTNDRYAIEKIFAHVKQPGREGAENSKDIKKSTPVIITEGQQAVIPDFEIDALARCLLSKMQAYFATPDGQAAFEKWQQQQKNT